jgi:hypothetical protein
MNQTDNGFSLSENLKTLETNVLKTKTVQIWPVSSQFRKCEYILTKSVQPRICCSLIHEQSSLNLPPRFSNIAYQHDNTKRFNHTFVSIFVRLYEIVLHSFIEIGPNFFFYKF